MRTTLLSWLCIALLACAQNGFSQTPKAEPDLTIWREFVQLVRSGPFPQDRIKPYQEALRDANLRVLAMMRQQARWDEWSKDPEVFRVGPRVHFVLPLTFDTGTDTYTFSFVLEGGRWYFQHIEAIQLRLDKLGSLPASVFPDLPEKTKTWMRAESEVSREVWLYNTLAAEKGKETARKWFHDGAGYALAARAWVPFVSPERAFVLYACWEQTNLRGNEVTLQSLGEEEAVIRMTSLWFQLYEVTGHLRQQIPLSDYRALFEARWRDRAVNAGWSIDFTYSGNEVVMRLRRSRSASEPAR